MCRSVLAVGQLSLVSNIVYYTVFVFVLWLAYGIGTVDLNTEFRIVCIVQLLCELNLTCVVPN